MGEPREPRAPLIPRYRDQGYRREDVDRRRRWIEEQTACSLPQVGASELPTETFRGNIENPIGTVQMPLGVAGPLQIRGEHADGVFYVPLATTEGALVRSYERGMALLTRSGGAEVRIHQDENRVAPIFLLDSVAAAQAFARTLEDHLEALKSAAEATTGHGKLRRVECHPVGRKVIVNLVFFTADAQGMNMIVKAADAVCRWIATTLGSERYQIFSGYNGEKRAAGSLFAGGKGKRVVAGAEIPARLLRAFLRVSPEAVVELWHNTVLGHLQSAALGYNGHYANGLTALFIACGQDVANVANSAVGITDFEVTPGGDLYASVTLPSLSVATVGGGTGLGTSPECLKMLGCLGAGGAPRLAEIAAATLLAGELSMAAAIASGEFVAAHEEYGRNRPTADPKETTP